MRRPGRPCIAALARALASFLAVAAVLVAGGPASAQRMPVALAPVSKEGLEIDLSVRAVSITSSFGGVEITVFGSVTGSRQPSPEAGYYDVIVAVEGTPVGLVARRKTQTTGIWINTSSVRFDDVPSYYAIAATRPLDEIASPVLRSELMLGFEYLPLSPAPGEAARLSYEDLADFRQAVTRLKQKEGLYTVEDYGVVFTGRSLFRSTIALPPNVPLGPLTVRAHLFHDGKLLGSESARMTLQREGTQRHLHDFAIHTPFIYGVLTVVISVVAGIAASHIFRRSGH